MFRYEIMQTCWQIDSNQRPSFTEISSQIMRIIESTNSENYLNAVGAEAYDSVNVSNDYAENESKSNDSSDEIDV